VIIFLACEQNYLWVAYHTKYLWLLLNFVQVVVLVSAKIVAAQAACIVFEIFLMLGCNQLT